MREGAYARGFSPTLGVGGRDVTREPYSAERLWILEQMQLDARTGGHRKRSRTAPRYGRQSASTSSRLGFGRDGQVADGDGIATDVGPADAVEATPVDPAAAEHGP